MAIPSTVCVPVSDPWWCYGHVWLVLSGPLLVVVAGLVTAWIAVRDPDPVLPVDPPASRVLGPRGVAVDKAQLPALQGRNHAATPVDGR